MLFVDVLNLVTYIARIFTMKESIEWDQTLDQDEKEAALRISRNMFLIFLPVDIWLCYTIYMGFRWCLVKQKSRASLHSYYNVQWTHNFANATTSVFLLIGIDKENKGGTVATGDATYITISVFF